MGSDAGRPRRRYSLLLTMGKATKLSAAGALIVILASAGVLLVSGLISGVVGGVPSEDVATIDKAGSISKTGPDGFDHWYVIVNNSQNAQQGGDTKKKKPPDPSSTEGQALTAQVMEFLITGDWIAGEAKERGLNVTDAEVKRQFTQTKEQSFPTDRAYKKFLKDSGQTQDDVLFRVRLEVLSNKVRDAVTEGTDKISDSEIEDYYDDNKDQFAQPEQRDIKQVVTKGEKKADEARKALENDERFAAVVEEFSTDPSSKANKGKLEGVTEGTQDPALDGEIFKADKNSLVGPIKTAQGYAVFKVTKIQEGSQQTLAQSESGIEQLLVSQKQQDALNNFQKTFKNTWRSRTDCAQDYVVPSCGNGRYDSLRAAAPAIPPTPGQPKPVPGASGAAPAALDNIDPNAATSPVAPLEVTDPSGDQPLAYTPADPTAAAPAPGGLGAGAGLQPGAAAGPGLPLALGGAPPETPAGAGGLPPGGLPQGLPGGGAPPPPPPAQ